MKQETLKEVALRLYPIIKTNDYMDMYDKNFDIRNSFITGVKYQEQETIEEVFEWLTTNNYLTDLKETMIKDFNKFKNK